jgi:Tol biopolymer transport system component
MQAKEIIEKLKLTFNELVGQPAPVALMDATLEDGTPVKITELTVGGIVTINDVPAPVGEHKLSDGTKIVVGENGAITEIEAPEEAPIAPAAEDMGAKFSAFESVTNEKFSSYEAKFASYETRFADYEVKLSKATTIIEGLINLTKELSEAPTGMVDSAAQVVNNFKEEKKKSYDFLFS